MKTEINIALIELVISLAIGILTVYLTKLVLMRFYLKKTNEQNPYQNLSFMIFLCGTIFSISYIVFGIMEPLSSTIKLLSTRNTSLIMLWFEIFKYLGMFLILGYSFGATIVFAAYNLFSKLTKNLDEYDEISKNNVGVALLIAVLTIVIALFTKDPFIIFVESFIPYPDVPNIM
jgi:hypothetical protein